MRNIIDCFWQSKIGRIYECLRVFAEKYLFSALLLFMRYHLAKIFWYAGLAKISSWSSTIALFKYEYQVPLIPPVMAAYMATAVELALPGLLLFGIMTRLAALPLLAMTAVIQFTYLEHMDHLYWAVILGTIITYGPGRLSIDYLFTERKDDDK